MKSARALDATRDGIDGGSGARGARRNRARRGLLAAAVGSVLLLATACSSGGSAAHTSTENVGAAAGSPSASASAAPANSVAQITILPKNDSTNVDTSGTLKVSAASGKLTTVKVAASDGTAIAGTLAADGGSWTPTGALRSGTKYAVSATAVDANGLSVTDQSSFTTLTPGDTTIGNFNVDAGATYGVGMEVSVTFTHDVSAADQAAVKQAITVTADPAVDVEGHWFGGSRIDYRPQNYWAPGTKVTLHLHLDGVQTASGVYGKQYKDVSFTIGRSQTSVADNTAHTLTVYRNGAVYRTLPASLGDPDHTTYNGKMVITEKDPVVDMDSTTVGLGAAYHIKDVPHGMRLTTSGTFVHGNYWRPVSVFGSENTSHGCVGLHDVQGGGDPNTPAAWFYNNSMIGDVVQVVHSPDKIVDPSNGLNGWNMSWAAWTS
ncbi:Ig-like domain-containing protein [Streptacidiphilus sp. EB129]|uniref:L,D-transpeptidase n=1 Tax=Streptacidiphilus sp. EB129 TaxID=3156262 RepID=UPI003512BCBF